MTEQENPEWQPPPPPEKVQAAEAPQMSEAASLGNIFVEPGRTFEDMRRKPRFLLAGLITIAVISLFQITFVEKVGLEEIVRARIESSKRARDLPKEQKDAIIEQQSGSIAKYATFIATPVVIAVIFVLGGLIYWGGSNAMGGDASFLRGLSVWVYSSFPPALIFMIGNFIVLMLKSVDDIDLAHSQSGLVKGNLGFFVDANTSPVLAAVLGSIDIFGIWGWILAAIGLQKIAKISSTGAWTIVLLLALVGVIAKVVSAMFF